MTTESPRRRGPRGRPTRRQVLAGALTGAGLLGAGFAASTRPNIFTGGAAPDPLRSVTVAFDENGTRSTLHEDDLDRLPSQSRVVADAADPEPARRQQKFLDGCSPWLHALPEHRRDFALSALLDLWVLTDSLPATVASWAQPWRFIWPRDAAFSAVALARVDAADLAWRHLLHLQSVQSEDGSFAARVSPDTGAAPDDRASQFDSVGLSTWAISEVHRSASAAGSPVDLSEMAPMITRSARRLLDHTRHGSILPPVTPDYWEVVESQVTLGTAGPTLIGFEALSSIAGADENLFDDVDGGAGAIWDGASTFASTFSRTFGANGLQRYPTSGGLDSAIAYLPAAGFGETGRGGADERRTTSGRTHGHGSAFTLEVGALDRVWDRLLQPAGGIKPGHGWIFDRSSWTPSTSLMGLGFARLGQRRRAEEIFDWLADHRTAAGSLPEKVTAEGDPVSVAPLSWTASNVIIGLDELYARRD